MHNQQEIKEDLLFLLQDSKARHKHLLLKIYKYIEKQHKVMREMKNKTSFINYMKIAKENLALAEQVKQLEEELKITKQTYEAYKKAVM
ncbi:hypothetical protein [Niallia sp. 01092]|uniref:hypothetical protein n=1 Tax=unclassified Niallia TaxID=2837522 RepID=UPI003FD0ACDB